MKVMCSASSLVNEALAVFMKVQIFVYLQDLVTFAEVRNCVYI